MRFANSCIRAQTLTVEIVLADTFLFTKLWTFNQFIHEITFYENQSRFPSLSKKKLRFKKIKNKNKKRHSFKWKIKNAGVL